MKRNLYIIIGAVVVVIIVIGVFWFLASNRSTPAATGTTGTLPTTGSQGTGPSSGSGSGSDGNGGANGSQPGTTGGIKTQSSTVSFGVISNDQAADYFIDPQNNAFIINTTGTIEKVTGGQASVLSAQAVADIVAAGFSYNGKKAYISSGNPKDPQSTLFDVSSTSWSTLPAGILSAAWAPSDLRLAYLTSAATGTMSLSVIDASNLKKAATVLLTLNASDLYVRWASATQLLLADRPSALSAGSIWLFDTVQKTLTPIVEERSGLEYLWSGPASSSAPMGLVFSGSSGASSHGGSLELDSLTGTLAQQLKFISLPSKCVFHAETSTTAAAPYLALYCGIPRDQSPLSFASLPDAYNQMALFTSDDFYRINLATGDITTIWNDANQNIDASDVKFFNNTLFFINRYDQKLYGLVLNQPSSSQ